MELGLDDERGKEKNRGWSKEGVYRGTTARMHPILFGGGMAGAVYIGHKVPRKEAVKIANVNWLYMRLDGWTRMRLRAFKEKKKSYLSNTSIRNDFLKNLGLKSLSTNLSFRKKGFL